MGWKTRKNGGMLNVHCTAVRIVYKKQPNVSVQLVTPAFDLCKSWQDPSLFDDDDDDDDDDDGRDAPSVDILVAELVSSSTFAHGS